MYVRMIKCMYVEYMKKCMYVSMYVLQNVCMKKCMYVCMYLRKN